MKKLLPLAILALTACVLAALFLANRPSPQAPTAQISFTQPYTLTSHTGATVTPQTFLGKPTLYFFGFTHCPDVCPTTLSAIADWLTQLGPAAANLNVAFISVDPERDTPATLAPYVQAFSPHITGLSGTAEQLAAVAKQFMVYYAKVPQPDGTYTMSHSSMVLLADAHGTFQGTLDAHTPTPQAVARLKELLKGR